MRASTGNRLLLKEFLYFILLAKVGKYSLCSSFYKLFTDRRTTRIKVLTVYQLFKDVFENSPQMSK